MRTFHSNVLVVW